jgi:hypothetical protein
MSSNNEKHLDIDPCENEMASKFAEMQMAMCAMQIEKDNLQKEKDNLQKEKDIAVATTAKVLAEAGASAVTPGSGKKIIYTDTMHKMTHAKVVALTVPALLELKKLENNYEAIWWCVKHAEALIKGDRSDGFDKYCTWAKDVKREALKEYISPAAGASE